MTKNSGAEPFCGAAVPVHTPLRIVTAAVMGEYVKRIMVALLAEIEALRDLGPTLEEGTTRGLADLRDLGIPYGPANWSDVPLSAASRKAYSRATARLERVGLVSRVPETRRDRVTHLRLTPAGLRWALALVGRRADRAALAEGLRRTTWGQELAAALTAGPSVCLPRVGPGHDHGS